MDRTCWRLYWGYRSGNSALVQKPEIPGAIIGVTVLGELPVLAYTPRTYVTGLAWLGLNLRKQNPPVPCRTPVGQLLLACPSMVCRQTFMDRLEARSYAPILRKSPRIASTIFGHTNNAKLAGRRSRGAFAWANLLYRWRLARVLARREPRPPRLPSCFPQVEPTGHWLANRL